MNFKRVAHNLGIICLLLAVAMAFSLPWALPCLGGEWMYESHGVQGLVLSILVSVMTGGSFLLLGKGGGEEPFFRREAIATVGLGWILAVILGSLPYVLSHTCREMVFHPGGQITFTEMSSADALYESVSGFTTTGGTVLSELEEPIVISRCVLFWRSTTHFVGGLGIIVLLVALLDTGMAGKSLVQREMTGPKQATPQHFRMQAIVRRTVSVYLGLNLVLMIVLLCAGMSVYDALCHAFGTIATGGMGTHNTSLVYFTSTPGFNAPLIEWSMGIALFLSGMNLLLLFFFLTGKRIYLLENTEWRIYVFVVFLATASVFCFRCSFSSEVHEAIRHSFFHVVSTCTTAGYACSDYTRWLPQTQALLMFLMLFTACSGSTCGGPKVVRYILLYKTFRIESERFYRPNIVRSVQLNGETIEPSVIHSVLLYFSMMFVCILVSWMFLMLWEPNVLWQLCAPTESKAGDLFTAVLSHFSNVGPAWGIFGPMENYGKLTDASKLVLVGNMLLGRLEFFGIFLLFSPAFWRK